MLKRITLKRLGELLVEQSIISPDQLAKALAVQQTKGRLLGEILVELGFCNEEAIAQVLTTQYGFPYLPLTNYEVDPEVVKLVPKNVAHQFQLIPVDRVGNTLTVAMSNPLNNQAVEDVEMITHCKVVVFVTTATDVRKAIQKYYPDSKETKQNAV